MLLYTNPNKRTFLIVHILYVNKASGSARIRIIQPNPDPSRIKKLNIPLFYRTLLIIVDVITMAYGYLLVLKRMKCCIHKVKIIWSIETKYRLMGLKGTVSQDFYPYFLLFFAKIKILRNRFCLFIWGPGTVFLGVENLVTLSL